MLGQSIDPDQIPMTQKCGNCGHNFGFHWSSFDGEKSGCGYSYCDQREGDYDCNVCQGFAIIIRVKQKAKPHVQSMGDYTYGSQFDR